MEYSTVLCYMTSSYSYNTIVITSLIMLTCIVSYYIVKSNITVGYIALKHFVVYCVLLTQIRSYCVRHIIYDNLMLYCTKLYYDTMQYHVNIPDNKTKKDRDNDKTWNTIKSCALALTPECLHRPSPQSRSTNPKPSLKP